MYSLSSRSCVGSGIAMSINVSQVDISDMYRIAPLI